MARIQGGAMLTSIRIKGCKRCGGNLYLERDQFGIYVSCIQCGAEYEAPAEQAVRRADSKSLVEVGDGEASEA